MSVTYSGIWTATKLDPYSHCVAMLSNSMPGFREVNGRLWFGLPRNFLGICIRLK